MSYALDRDAIVQTVFRGLGAADVVACVGSQHGFL